jgi:hypothetical protein
MAAEKRDAGGQMTVLQHGTMAVTVLVWLGMFLVGTMVNSAPYRARFASLGGSFGEIVSDGLIVGITYTLTNIGLLCLLASVLGSLGATANLGADGEADPERDTTAPLVSAILRGFLIYLALLAGVLILGTTPAEPTQTQYVRLAGVTSFLGFAVSYRPELFAGLLARAGKVFEK